MTIERHKELGMERSAFVSENQKSIKLDGFSEQIIIRPLSADERGKSLITSSSRVTGQKPVVRKSNSKAAEFGIVRIGGTSKASVTKWRNIVHADVIQAIGKEIWAITS